MGGTKHLRDYLAELPGLIRYQERRVKARQRRPSGKPRVDAAERQTLDRLVRLKADLERRFANSTK